MQVTRRRLLTVMAGVLAACRGAPAPSAPAPPGTPSTTATTRAAANPGPSTTDSPALTTSTSGASAAVEPTDGASPPPAGTTPAVSPAPIVVSGPAGGLVVIERAAWGAAAPLAGMEPHTIERLTVHHTAVRLADNRVAPDRLAAHQSFHQNDRGWPDLAYHFAIDGAGNVYEGRDPGFRGDTATSYDPTGHFLVVLEGNFDEQSLPSAQLEALVSVLGWAAGAFGAPPGTIAGHRDYAATSCPGAAVYRHLADGTVQAAVEALLAGGVVGMTYLRGEAATARVEAIRAGG